MSYIPQTISLLCNSDPESGALNNPVASDGSRFVVQLNEPISIPSNARSCTLSVEQASIWNVSYNISADIKNNKFVFTTNNVTRTITIPDGQYSLDAFNSMLSRSFQTLGLNENLIVLTGDDSNSRVVISFNDTTTTIDFTVANTCREMLGFLSRLVPLTPPAAGSTVIELADATAKFNRVNSYVIQTDLVSDGIPVNNDSAGVIANVQITVSPGKLINYSPRHPTVVNASELVGHNKGRFEIRLRDQNGRSVNTVGEYFTCLLVIKYLIPA
jgi:hypothetical protein